MKYKNKFLLGADPELFIIDKNGDAKSAIGIIKGTKENPFPISKNGHSVQVDNVLLEFNIPPSDNPIKMNEDISFILNWFLNNLPEGDKPHIVSSMIFHEKYLQSDKAKEFGCDPDFDAWREEVNTAPDGETNLRVAGGHVHISYPEDEGITFALKLIRACDLFLGVPSVLKDKDKRRRSLYGKAGAFRFKNYSDGSSGVEYRTLSNFWIKSNDHMKFVFDQIDKALSYAKNNGLLDANSKLGNDIVNCINNSDEHLAARIINEHSIL